MAVVWVLVAFVVMEPFTYLAHRFVMHGRGMVWHRSHHRPPAGRFEANDWFPIVFGSATMLVFAVGFNVEAVSVLVPICVGISLYGIAYALLHDGYIHRRFPVLGGGRYVRFVAESHALHHRFGGEPYGMLAPVVPRSLRARAGALDIDAVRRGRERVDAAPGS